jgi:predicted Zn-dependent protease with MMP-like domain
MTRAHFRRLVAEAVDTIPRRFRRHLKNIAIVVEDEPSPGLLAEMEIEPPDTLFGLYQGVPLTERRWDYGNTLPDRITIFQFPIEDVSETEEDVVTEVGETLIHEVGHFFGLSEDELEEIEERYWRGRNGEAGDDPDADDEPGDDEGGAGPDDDKQGGRS